MNWLERSLNTRKGTVFFLIIQSFSVLLQPFLSVPAGQMTECSFAALPPTQIQKLRPSSVRNDRPGVQVLTDNFFLCTCAALQNMRLATSSRNYRRWLLSDAAWAGTHQCVFSSWGWFWLNCPVTKINYGVFGLGGSHM